MKCVEMCDVFTLYDTEHPPNQSVNPSARTSLPDVPVDSKKRQLDDIDQSVAKRPRLSTGTEGERAQSADKVR